MADKNYENNGIQFTQPSTEALNGMPDESVVNNSNSNTTSTTKSTTTKTSKAKVNSTQKPNSTPKAKAKASTTQESTGGGFGVPSTNMEVTATPRTPLPTYHSQQEWNWIPVFMVAFLVVVLFYVLMGKFLMWSSKKYPVHGGFAHHHKHTHPGTPKPKVFKH